MPAIIKIMNSTHNIHFEGLKRNVLILLLNVLLVSLKINERISKINEILATMKLIKKNDVVSMFSKF